MVIAHKRKNATVGRGTSVVCVAKDVASAIDARSLSVPKSEDAVMGPVAAQSCLLRTP